jgi:murein DD-endopeptidase MepM/ murein hydrolase activator NlpD
VYVTSGAVITYTDFLNGYPGQELRIIANDANKTFDFTGTNLKGNNGVDYAAAAGDAIFAVFDGTNWYCQIVQG